MFFIFEIILVTSHDQCQNFFGKPVFLFLKAFYSYLYDVVEYIYRKIFDYFQNLY